MVPLPAPDLPDPDTRKLVGAAGSSKPIRPGESRSRVRGLLGEPCATDASGRREHYFVPETIGRCYLFALVSPEGHQFGVSDVTADRYVVVRYDEAGTITSAQLLNGRRYNQERARLKKKGIRIVDDTDPVVVTPEW